MNWYKTAQNSNIYALWLQSQIESLRGNNIEPINILRKYQIMTHDISKWYKETKYPLLNNLSFEEAAKMTKTYLDNKEKNRIKSKVERSESGIMEKIEEERKLKEQYMGKECTLNGYPAKIESDKYGYPTITNIKGQKIGGIVSRPLIFPKYWNFINNNFPNFYGGTYALKDNAEEIQRKIKEEESRPFHPVQKDILKILKYRLSELVQKSGQYKEHGQYYPFIETPKIQEQEEQNELV